MQERNSILLDRKTKVQQKKKNGKWKNMSNGFILVKKT